MSDGLITFLASFLIWVILFGIIMLWLVDGRIKKEVALHAIFASLLAWILAEMVKSLVPSMRPFDQNGLTPLTLTVPIGSAFPSGHTAAAIAIAVSIFLHKKGLGLAFLIGGVGVGIGRFLSNVHFPLDILGGAVVGILCAITVQKIHVFRIISNRK